MDYIIRFSCLGVTLQFPGVHLSVSRGLMNTGAWHYGNWKWQLNVQDDDYNKYTVTSIGDLKSFAVGACVSAPLFMHRNADDTLVPSSFPSLPSLCHFIFPIFVSFVLFLHISLFPSFHLFLLCLVLFNNNSFCTKTVLCVNCHVVQTLTQGAMCWNEGTLKWVSWCSWRKVCLATFVTSLKAMWQFSMGTSQGQIRSSSIFAQLTDWLTERKKERKKRKEQKLFNFWGKFFPPYSCYFTRRENVEHVYCKVCHCHLYWTINRNQSADYYWCKTALCYI